MLPAINYRFSYQLEGLSSWHYFTNFQSLRHLDMGTITVSYFKGNTKRLEEGFFDIAT